MTATIFLPPASQATDVEVANAIAEHTSEDVHALAQIPIIGNGPNQAVAGNDARLSDQRVPLPGSVDESKIVNGGLPLSAINGLEVALNAAATDTDLATEITARETGDATLTQAIANLTAADVGAVDVALLNTDDGIPLLVDGVLDPSVIPVVSFVTVITVNSQAAMLASNAAPGTFAVRTDVGKTFVLQASPATSLSNWTDLPSPTSGVTSVDGEIGTVSLATKYVALTGAQTVNGIKNYADGLQEGGVALNAKYESKGRSIVMGLIFGGR